MSWFSQALNKAGVWWRSRKVLPTVEKSPVVKVAETVAGAALTSEATTLAEQEEEKL